MRYRIALHQSDAGISVSVPGLPGCWSQGATEVEALESIKDAIREYLAVVDEPSSTNNCGVSRFAKSRSSSSLAASGMPITFRVRHQTSYGALSSQ